MILSLVLGVALAQETAVTGGEIPQFNAQSFRPAVDSYQFLWINDTSMGKSGTFNYRSTVSYASSPVVYEDYLGTQYNLLDSVTQLDVSAGFTKGRLRYALSAPVILNASGETAPGVSTADLSELGLGEMMADVKLQLLDRNTHRLGMALTGRSSLPTTTTDSPLGTDGFMFEIEGGMDAHLGLSTLAFNVGHRQQPEVPTESVTWGSQLYSRVGLGHPFDEERSKGVALEYNVASLYANMGGGDALAQELMLSGWYAVHEIYQMRLGVSKGLSTGMTTPAWRGVVSVSFLHKTEADTDEDGVLDHSDVCPATPEDIDQFEDEDGCPEPTKVTVLLMDHLGHEVRDAHWTSANGKFSGPGHSSFYMQAGTIEIDVDDPKYVAEPMIVQVKDQAEQDVIIEIDAIMGSLRVIIEDEAGKEIPTAVWSVDGVKGASFQPTGYLVPLKPGEHEVIVQAPGYRMIKKTVMVVANETEEIHMIAKPSKVTYDLEILDKVFFKTDSDEIDEISHHLLDEVAEVMEHHQRIELVHIEGHTDSQGDDAYNKDLSQRRANEVMKYLIAKGITEERLDATGFGEEKPIDTNETVEGRHNNRRVIFRIDKHHGDDSVKDSSEKAPFDKPKKEETETPEENKAGDSEPKPEEKPEGNTPE